MRIGLVGLIMLLAVAAAGAYFLNPTEQQFRDYEDTQLKAKGFWTQLASPLVCADIEIKNNYVYSTFEHRCMGVVAQTCTGAFGQFYCKNAQDDGAKS